LLLFNLKFLYSRWFLHNRGENSCASDFFIKAGSRSRLEGRAYICWRILVNDGHSALAGRPSGRNDHGTSFCVLRASNRNFRHRPGAVGATASTPGVRALRGGGRGRDGGEPSPGRRRMYSTMRNTWPVPCRRGSRPPPAILPGATYCVYAPDRYRIVARLPCASKRPSADT